MEVRFFPRTRPLVSGVAALGLAELAPVHAAAAAAVGARRENLVEHLVEDDHLDEVARHPLVVERRVDADDAVVVEVDAHLDRSLAAARRAAAPARGRLPPGAGGGGGGGASG